MLEVGQEIEEAELARLSVEDEEQRCRSAALEYLKRSRSAGEVERRLLRSGYAERAVAAVLEWLRELDLVDDGELARRWVDYRLNERRLGPARLRGELGRRGVERELIEAALSGREEEELVAAREEARRRVTRLEGLPPAELRRKLGDALRRRGFGWETIRRTIDELLAEE